MPNARRSYWLLLIFYFGLCAFRLPMPFSFKIDQSIDPKLASLPLEIGEWKGKDEPLDERTYEILETRNVFSRIYKNAEGTPMNLLLVSSDKDRRVAHPPEVCFLSSNYTITHEANGNLAKGDLPFREFLAENLKNPAEKEQVLYLYKVGRRFTTNYYAQQLQFAWDRLSRGESQVLLIRLASPVTTPEKTKKELQDFLSQVVSLLAR